MEINYLIDILFDKDCPKCSPIFPTYTQVPVHKKDGEIVYEQKVQDLKSVIESNGSSFDWQLEALLAAGIDPSSKINTSTADRLEVETQLQALSNSITNTVAESTLDVESNE